MERKRAVGGECDGGHDIRMELLVQSLHDRLVAVEDLLARAVYALETMSETHFDQATTKPEAAPLELKSLTNGGRI